MEQPQTSSSARAPAWAVALFLASLSLWMGAAAFFSAGVLPVLFTQLEPGEAGRVAALLFPGYFRAGLAAALIGCLAVAILARGGGRRWRAVAALFVAMTLAQAWTTLVIHPEMATTRGVADKTERFQELHRLSVRLNGVVLGGGVVLLACGGILFRRRDDRA